MHGMQGAPFTVLERLEQCSGTICNGVHTAHTVLEQYLVYYVYACNHALLYSLLIRIIHRITNYCHFVSKCTFLLIEFCPTLMFKWRNNILYVQ